MVLVQRIYQILKNAVVTIQTTCFENKQRFIFTLTNLAGFSETRTIISLNIINQLFFVMKMQDPFCELQTENLNIPSKHNLLYKVVLRWAKGLLVTIFSPLCKIFKTKCMHTNSKCS
jgi:hypothetical protein